AMAAARVSIPAAVRRTIQNIKEIAGNHTDEEVYAALRECDMDPNETAQKLLHQGRWRARSRQREMRVSLS
uniref:GBF-interacting protein 1 N-terminal domain-containing protein n=1 Tax=Aegilops tauschii subsp. strangulata TaxID=200361 RepID=A0A453KIL1_AEGTS